MPRKKKLPPYVVIREVRNADGSRSKHWHVRRLFPTLERAASGKIKYQQSAKRCFPETEERARELNVEIEEEYRRASGQTFNMPDSAAVYFKLWLNDIVRNRIAGRTFEDYRTHVEKYLVPHFGNKPIRDLLPIHIQNFYSQLEKKGKLWLIPKIHATLRAALFDAMRLDLITQNPCKKVILPKTPKTRAPIFTHEEAKRFLRHLEAAENGLIFELMIYSGLRPAEALALRWQDVDFIRHQIKVEQAIVRLNSVGGFTFKEPKTKLSKRTIPIPERLAEKLNAHWEKQIEMRDRRKSKNQKFTDYDLVFCTRFGTPLFGTNLARRDFKQILEAAGLPQTTFSPKVLRHVHASFLLASGESIKDVQERLGHSTSQVTLQIYSHTLPNSQKGVTERFNRLLEESDPN